MDPPNMAYMYAAFFVVLPSLLLSLDAALRTTFLRRIAVASTLLVLLTPCALSVPYTHAVAGSIIGTNVGLELWRIRAHVPAPSLVCALLVWCVIPTYHCLTHAPVEDITFAMATVLLSDVYQFIGGAVIGLGAFTLKPFPSLSPRKSVGGYVFSVIFTTLTCGFVFPARGPAACTLVIVVGFAGDIAASLLKRTAGVKDFGTSLGAHGGWVDRFDGANAAVAVWVTACAAAASV